MFLPAIRSLAGEAIEEKVPRLMSKSQAAGLTDSKSSPEERIVDDRGPWCEKVPGRVALPMGAARVDRHPVYRYIWLAANILLIFAMMACVCGSVWEYSTRQYLRGFSDAVVPSDADSAQKVNAILTWMAHGPSRHNSQEPDELATRDPLTSLNYKQLLDVCGGATNAFVNLAISSGLQARRLLLLDSHRRTMHVVAEVWIEKRWVVVDPGFHFIARDESGRYLTREDMENQDNFKKVTGTLPGYLPIYSYSSTAHVHLSRIPIVGVYIRRVITWIWPGWEESINWTLLLERDSYAVLAGSLFALVFLIIVRQLLSIYGSRKLGIGRKHLHTQIWKAGTILFGHQH